MTDTEFEGFVQEGIRELPKWVQEKLVNVVFFVKDDLSTKQRKDEELDDDETLFGLYEGVPLSVRGNNPPELPDTITIFKKPILEHYSNTEEVRQCVINTVWHEVAHFLGHDEDWVEAEEQKRGMIL